MKFNLTHSILLFTLFISSGFSQDKIGKAERVGTIDFKGAGGIPGLRLGDLDGDGKMELVMGQPKKQPGGHDTQEVVRVTAFKLTGEVLWQYTRPGNPNLGNHRATSDIPIQVYDWDGDGSAEVIAAFSPKELTFLNGKDGKIIRTLPIPQGRSKKGASGSNDCIIIANLRGTTWPQDFIVKTRYTQIWGINGESGKVLWTHKASGKDMLGDNLGHFGYAFNADDDKMDEYLAGHHMLDHDGKVLWHAKGLSMHIDAISVGDMDGNPDNGLEVAIGSQVGVTFDTKGKEIWRDKNVTSNGQGIQHIAMGDFRPDMPGKEVVMLERIGPRNSKGRDANILVSATGELIWKEKREGKDYGWLTVTERITNWEGDGADHILSYRRTTKPPEIINGEGKVIATFPHDLKGEDLAQHADLCGDDKEEVIIYNGEKAYIYANGGCDLDEPPRQTALPQNRRLFNATVYSGWEAVDYTFYTPGSVHAKLK